MKHILCALMEPNEEILRPIYEYGREHNWQIERCGRQIPGHWSGDGIISDYLELPDFTAVMDFNSDGVATAAATGKHPYDPPGYAADRRNDRRLFHGQGFYEIRDRGIENLPGRYRRQTPGCAHGRAV